MYIHVPVSYKSINARDRFLIYFSVCSCTNMIIHWFTLWWGLHWVINNWACMILQTLIMMCMLHSNFEMFNNICFTSLFCYFLSLFCSLSLKGLDYLHERHKMHRDIKVRKLVGQFKCTQLSTILVHVLNWTILYWYISTIVHVICMYMYTFKKYF